MFYDERNIKYCLLCFDPYEEQEGNSYGENPLPLSGLFNWANIFKGKRAYPSCKADYEEFNLIHVNVTTRNLFLIPEILKSKSSDCKLLLNIDFSIDMWKNSLPLYPELILSLIDKADYIFAVEPEMANLLSLSLGNRHVACIPHPVATHLIENYRVPERINQIGFSIHRYDDNVLIPAFLARLLHTFDFQSIVLGGVHASKANIQHLFTFYKETCPFEELIQTLAPLFALYETYTIHSYGRLTAECACLGIPVIGGKYVYSIAKCFPDLALDKPNDFTNALSLFSKLSNDAQFYKYVSQKAIDLSKYFSFANCKKLMLDFLNGDH